MPTSMKDHNMLLIKVVLQNRNTRLMARWHEGYSWKFVEKINEKTTNNDQSQHLVLGGNFELSICSK